jgi:hypothetical protein
MHVADTRACYSAVLAVSDVDVRVGTVNSGRDHWRIGLRQRRYLDRNVDNTMSDSDAVIDLPLWHACLHGAAIGNRWQWHRER